MVRKIYEFCRSLDRLFEAIESCSLIFVLSCMIVLALVQVILRNAFSSGLLWGDILLRHLVLVIGFLGASLATRENRHINIDILYRSLDGKSQAAARTVTNLFSASVSGLLGRAAYAFVREEHAAGSTLILGIPVWLFAAVILIGFSVITFRFLVKAVFPRLSSRGSEGSN